MSTTEIQPYVNEDGEVLISGQLAARVAALLDHVPVDDETGGARIAEQLLGGATPEDLNQPWDATGGRALIGKVIRIDEVVQRPSQFQQGLRAFLVVRGEDTQTGEPITFTTSAMAVVIQLARCCAEGWLPAWAEVEQAARPTEAGYLPYHLRFVAAPKNGQR